MLAYALALGVAQGTLCVISLASEVIRSLVACDVQHLGHIFAIGASLQRLPTDTRSEIIKHDNDAVEFAVPFPIADASCFLP